MRIAKLAVAATSLALCFLALEIGLWLFDDAEGGWFAAGPQRLRFLERYVHRNSNGFRDREFQPAPPSGSTRILAVGDSFTFGDGIRNVDDTWPRVLQRELCAGGRPTEVYNLGVPGSNTAYQRRLLESVGYPLAPDRVVIGFVLNDVEPPGADRAIVHREVFVPLVPIRAIDEPLTRLSYAYSWLRAKKNVIYSRLGYTRSYEEYLHGLYDDRDVWDRFVAEARGVVRDCRTHRIPVTVALFPQFGAGASNRFDRERARVARLFRESGAEVVDLHDAYRGLDPSSLMVSPTDAHPNEAAQRIAAKAIAAALLRSEDAR